jgi:branched-subunit amino acid ABC-type transport system permease component
VNGTLEVVISGLVDGCVYALIALGMTLVYSISRVINLAQGGFVVLAALTAVSLQQRTGWAPLVVAPVIVVLFAGVLAGVDRAIILPGARRTTPERMLLITVGVLQAIGGLLLVAWGNLPYTMQAFPPGRTLVVGSLRINSQYLWIIGVLALSVVGLWAVLHRTQLGLVMRATANNPQAASLLGVNVDRVRLIAFSLSGAMAALAGATVIPVTFLQFNTVTPYAVAGFIAAVAGGLGSNVGAVLGGLALGLLQGIFSRYTSSELAEVVAIGALIVLLLFRPTGLLGRVSEVRR